MGFSERTAENLEKVSCNEQQAPVQAEHQDRNVIAGFKAIHSKIKHMLKSDQVILIPMPTADPLGIRPLQDMYGSFDDC